MIRRRNGRCIFRTEASQGERDKHLRGRNQSIITHQPCGHTAEKTVPLKNLCKRCYLGGGGRKKKRIGHSMSESAAPILQQHSGGSLRNHSEEESGGGFAARAPARKSFCLSSISFSQLSLCNGNMWCVKHLSA